MTAEKKKRTWPTRKEAEELLRKAEVRRPGGWVKHSEVTARVAERIAEAAGLDKNKAYVLGLLHDVGRCKDMGIRHITEGYRILKRRGWDDAARIALTHSFFADLMPDEEYAMSEADDEKDAQLMKTFSDKLRASEIEYDDYDYLIMLADCLSLKRGVVTLNDRFADLMVRHNFPDIRTRFIKIWKIKERFDQMIDGDVYDLFRDELQNNALKKPQGLISIDD